MASFFKEDRFEEAKSEALRTLDVLEELGATDITKTRASRTDQCSRKFVVGFDDELFEIVSVNSSRLDGVTGFE